jgi:hypothetical protein
MPSVGATMMVCASLLRASLTCASAAFTRAWAVSAVVRRRSFSSFEKMSSPCCARAHSLCAAAALARTSSSDASALSSCDWAVIGFNRASTWPLRTRSPASTSTSEIRPASPSLPMGMSLRALISPVKDTFDVTAPSAGTTTVTSGSAAASLSEVRAPACGRTSIHATAANTSTAPALAKRHRHLSRAPDLTDWSIGARILSPPEGRQGAGE